MHVAKGSTGGQQSSVAAFREGSLGLFLECDPNCSVYTHIIVLDISLNQTEGLPRKTKDAHHSDLSTNFYVVLLKRDSIPRLF